MTTKLDFSRPRLLRDDAEYELALQEVERLLRLNPDPMSDDGEQLELLLLLVDRYESAAYPIGQSSSPQSLVDFMLEQQGLTRSDIADVMGGKSRVSEFFSGKRALSLSQVKALRDLLGVPADLLIGAAADDPSTTAPLASEESKLALSIPRSMRIQLQQIAADEQVPVDQVVTMHLSRSLAANNAFALGLGGSAAAVAYSSVADPHSEIRSTATASFGTERRQAGVIYNQ